MPGKMILVSVPEIYHGFLPGFFRELIPAETAATCDNCAMWSDDCANSETIVFSRETKCCTHFPEIPNYLAGALLASKDPALDEGRNRMRALIASGTVARPHGIVRTAKWDALIRLSRESFGRSSTLRCPLFDSAAGACTIRPFWEVVCSSWFCKYTAGQTGREFWQAFRNYFMHLQTELIRYVLSSLGFKTAVIFEALKKKEMIPLGDLDDLPLQPGVYYQLWGDWAGKEEEMYREAFTLVSSLSPEEFEQITGISERLLLRRLEETRSELVAPELPNLLKRNPEIRSVSREEDGYVLTAYSPFDPIKVSSRLCRVLDFFDGKRTTAEIYRELLSRGEAVPSEETLLMLYQFRFLVPV
ncbi:MAG: hypothetical protein ACYC9O_09745 [Candidatus Latescibacterota bacterium]